MNKIKELFNSMTDEELKLGIKEIIATDESGIIGDVVREWTRKAREITGESIPLDLYMTQVNILKEAAFRWCLKDE